MTKVTFFKRDGVYYGFEEQGHTGYGEAGDDILCSALSAMTMLIINTVEISYASRVDYKVDEETTDIRLTIPAALPENEEDEKKRFAISGLLQGYFFQLNDLVEEYYDFLSVDEIKN
jgi:uncharacterized protein YsxB (DUF464 family)